MNYPKPYFRQVPTIGDLSIDYVFFEAECPILFTCVDVEDNLYLCVCCDIRDEQRWIVAPTDADKLLKMINNEITPYEVFHTDKLYVIRWKTGYAQEIIHECLFDEVDKGDLPPSDEYLDADEDEYDDYIERLNQDYYIVRCC